MELSLDKVDRTCVIDFVKKCREEYDRLLDEAPDIPAISIEAFNIEFPDRINKPDVCNGLSIIVSDETQSQISSRGIVSKWLGPLATMRRKSKDLGSRDELETIENV